MFGWLLRRLPQFLIADHKGMPYLRRYRIVHTRWLGVYVHEIMRSDDDRDLHDHPWSFVSVILRSGYLEYRPDRNPRLCKRGKVIFHRAEDAHRVELRPGKLGPEGQAPDRVCWSLVFVGPKRREWGFHTDSGWVPWEEYLDKKYGKGRWTQSASYQGPKKGN